MFKAMDLRERVVMIGLGSAMCCTKFNVGGSDSNRKLHRVQWNLVGVTDIRPGGVGLGATSTTSTLINFKLTPS